MGAAAAEAGCCFLHVVAREIGIPQAKFKCPRGVNGEVETMTMGPAHSKDLPLVLTSGLVVRV